jgi:hypothetical protein
LQTDDDESAGVTWLDFHYCLLEDKDDASEWKSHRMTYDEGYYGLPDLTLADGVYVGKFSTNGSKDWEAPPGASFASVDDGHGGFNAVFTIAQK